MKKLFFTRLILGIIQLACTINALCEKPTLIFSHERGFYYNSFELTISSNSSANSIKYTLDGSDPRTSPNSFFVPNPAVIPINPYINQGRAITPGVVVRACAVNTTDTSAVITNTYIFLAEVKYQSDVSPSMAPYWPSVPIVPSIYDPNLIEWMRTDYQLIDLGIDPEVVSKNEYYTAFEPALLEIPSISIATDPENLFKDSTGIYTNSTWHGIEWERPASVEFIYPNGEKVQSNVGIRIRGGWSRMGWCVKHSFRLFFRNDYGNGVFDFPLFADEGTSSFDKFDIKSSQNNSWHASNSSADFVHETFARDIQGDMGQPYTKSRYYHLYINGMYWGLYETQERPEASFAESYFGGDKNDYDVIKSSAPSYDYPPYTLEATDGNLDAAFKLWQIAKEGFTDANYFKVLGLNDDGSPNPAYPKLVDEFNLIDYMIIIYYSANHDGPGDLNGGTQINNFFGIYNRVKPDGFKFFIHDAETTFQSYSDNITNSPTLAGENFESFNPMWLHQQLMENENYRQKFADRAYKHLYNNGVLTVNDNTNRFDARAKQIDNAIIGESARWGDVGGESAIPYTKLGSWDPVIEQFKEFYLARRTEIVINQFKTMGWLNSISPPKFDNNDFTLNDYGTQIVMGNSFKLINPNNSGEIYYTLNNTDPRKTGGSISSEALLYTGEITATNTLFVKARVKVGDTWSPITEKTISLISDIKLIITEINYNPQQQIIGLDTLLSKNLEFIELKNHSTQSIDISAFKFTRGIDYEFPQNTIIQPDSLIVIAADTSSFKKLYGFSAAGQFSGTLNNDGENLLLVAPSGYPIGNVDYNTGETWYQATNGSGYTLVFRDYDNYQSISSKENWRVSTNRLGSPGKDDPDPNSIALTITEVLANSEAPYTDAIEMYNNSNSTVDISGWYLSDDRNTPEKWQIPTNQIIPSKGYKVFYEGHYENDTMKYAIDEFGQSFSISSGGENILLFTNNGSGAVDEFVCEYQVEATDNNISFGDYIGNSGYVNHVQLDTLFFGNVNERFLKSPVIFKTIMYHPATANYEFIVLKNRTDSIVDLYNSLDSSVTWKVNGIQFNFPPEVSLNPGDSLYIVEKIIAASTFKSIMKLGTDVQVYNYDGQLKNSSETIAIQKPVLVNSNSGNTFAYVNEEKLTYFDNNPWPAQADGDGYALQRKNEEKFANDFSNWSVIYNVLPVANAGISRRVKVNSIAQLDASDSRDVQGIPITFTWNLITKPEGSSAAISDAGNVKTAFIPDQEGKYIFSLEVNNNANKSAPAYLSLFAFENRAPYALMDSRSIRANVGTIASLNAARSFDPDYEDLNYSWELISSPEGSTAILEGTTLEIAELTPDVVGKYTISLIVDDGELYSTPITVFVNAIPASGLFENTLTNNILIYPNPVSSYITIEFYLQNSCNINISLSDINGRTVLYSEFEDLQAGPNNLSLDIEKLDIKNGIYVINLLSEEGLVSKKIVVSR